MKIALISSHFYPLKTSCAVQMKDLADELFQLGHEPIVIVPSHGINQKIIRQKIDNIEIFRIPAFKITEIGNYRRAINEVLLPICMIYGIKKINFPIKDLNAVIWYSPSIFFGPVVKFLKNKSNCPTYLILRDIFPEWALDLELINKNFSYFFFKMVAKFQYSLANVIGVQTQSNLVYFKEWAQYPNRKLEVLNNWQSPKIEKLTSIDLKNTNLYGRKIFVYIGNMGIAQGMNVLIDLAESLKTSGDIGFLFVGRGSLMNKLQKLSLNKQLNNILFFDEIAPEEIPNLLKLCHVGLIALDLRHKTHNIPGKFISYIQAGLPVLARINPDTDLEKLIQKENLGEVYSGTKLNEFKLLAEKLIHDQLKLKKMSDCCFKISKKLFSSNSAAKQIISSLSKF